MTVATPIYDIVFKYLMEDERIARTILFRTDFAATVRDAQGGDRLIPVELQKTWAPTETLRFRQYLGKQYADATNTYSPDGEDVHPRRNSPSSGRSLPLRYAYSKRREPRIIRIIRMAAHG